VQNTSGFSRNEITENTSLACAARWLPSTLTKTCDASHPPVMVSQGLWQIKLSCAKSYHSLIYTSRCAN